MCIRDSSDAVLFSAVGDPKFDNDPTAKVRPEQGLLAMRKKLGLFANIRPEMCIRDRGNTSWRTAPISVEKLLDELRVGVKG